MWVVDRILAHWSTAVFHLPDLIQCCKKSTSSKKDPSANSSAEVIRSLFAFNSGIFRTDIYVNFGRQSASMFFEDHFIHFQVMHKIHKLFADLMALFTSFRACLYRSQAVALFS